MPDTTDLQKLPDDMEPHEDHPSRHWDRTCPGCWDELVLKRERALEAQQAELSLLREVAKRAEPFDVLSMRFRTVSDEDAYEAAQDFFALVEELRPLHDALCGSLQAYKEFQKGSE